MGVRGSGTSEDDPDGRRAFEGGLDRGVLSFLPSSFRAEGFRFLPLFGYVYFFLGCDSILGRRSKVKMIGARKTVGLRLNPLRASRVASSSAAARRQQVNQTNTSRPFGLTARPVPKLVLEAAASDVAEPVEAAPEVSDREAVAYLRNLRGSPNKVRRVLDAIRGMSYEDALMALEFMPYRACEDILKVLYSAAANAKNNMGMNKSKLYISRCWADEGKTIKRPVPRARGRSDVRKKPGCHITMMVKER